MSIRDLATRLRTAARETNHRRLLVCRGGRRAAFDAAVTALDAAGLSRDRTTLVTTREGFGRERLDPSDAGELLGRTREAVVVDLFAAFSPNLLGRTVGAVEGGGLYVLVVPSHEAWGDAFRSSLAVPPFAERDVGTRFRERTRAMLDHPGVAVYDADDARVVRERSAGGRVVGNGDRVVHPPRGARFPERAYRSCLTTDQARAVETLERLAEPDEAVVIEANRGRGKSAAAGIAAAALAAEGRTIAVTAPSTRGAAEMLERAGATLSRLDAFTERTDGVVRAEGGGRVAYHEPAAFAAAAESADAAIVDEAAGLSVERLAGALRAPSAAFVTTVHGYEGAGRGFSIRFRDRLAASAARVTTRRMREPIRHAPGDPVESWAFRTLALDARSPVADVVREAEPSSVEYRRLSPATLAADERLLREAFGTLVAAHYRTEPDDLARLLDAPNLSTHALLHDGHVVSVALVAREGGLSADVRASMYGGGRIRGNLLPDLLTSQLRDPDAAAPVGYRVIRIATHEACRRAGFGSRLLSEIRASLAAGREMRTPSGERTLPPADYLGTAFGATPDVVSFWRANDYGTVHLSTTRGDASGEHSAVMVRPVTDAGRSLAARHSREFRDRIGGVLSDALRRTDADVVRAVLAACPAPVDPLVPTDEYDWRVVVGSSTGPGLYDVHPAPFRRLALAWLIDDETRAVEETDDASTDGTTGTGNDETNRDEATDPAVLTPRQERLLVRKVLQGWSWDETSAELGYVSSGACMRALGETYKVIVDRYGGSVAAAERDRLTD